MLNDGWGLMSNLISLLLKIELEPISTNLCLFKLDLISFEELNSSFGLSWTVEVDKSL